jgi:hypothetical protein
MEETRSYETVIPQQTRDKYSFAEVRNAASILNSCCPSEFGEVLSYLSDYVLETSALMTPGGAKSLVVNHLESFFYDNDWVETRLDTEIIAYRVPREAIGSFNFKNTESSNKDTVIASIEERLDQVQQNNSISIASTFQKGYAIDALKGRLAVDIEWNAKDGNLDRDIAAYRAWYDAGIIDGAVLITKDFESVRTLVADIWAQYETDKGLTPGEFVPPVTLSTTTSTQISKAKERILRGDGGGCPILLVGIKKECWDGVALADTGIAVKLMHASKK